MPAAIDTSIRQAIEDAFVELLLASPDLATGIDIVSASNRDAVVGPFHVFVLCTEFVPQVPADPNGIATVAIGIVTDLDDQSHADRQLWYGRVIAALSAQPVTGQAFQVVGGSVAILNWSIKTQKEDSQDRKVMDVLGLRVAACAI